MAAVTTNYSLPYQELGDPPDGADLGADLAAAVDAQLVLVNAKPIMTGAACSTNVALTTTEVDITGATVTFSTTKTNARYLVNASFYMAATTGNVNVATGKLAVDGVNQAAQANFTGVATLERANVAQSWVGTLAAAGSHTLKLRGVLNVGTGVTVNATSTAFTVVVFER